MTTQMSRRSLLGGAADTGIGIALAGNFEAVAGTRLALGYGDLVPDPAGLLSLPPGFSYRIVTETGVSAMADGVPTPSDPDANGVFPRENGFAIVNNHEIGGNEPYGVPALAGLTYDPGARGGTTTIEVDRDGKALAEYVSVAGTHNNCAGGITPWGTWLTCEETEARKNATLLKDHGYVFEVDPTSQAANVGKSGVPLKFLGRFAHEAVAVDPETHAIYETEDASGPNGLYFRWTPPAGFTGGKDALRELASSAGGDTDRKSVV
jgi:secreted PhoX family phosphatase